MNRSGNGMDWDKLKVFHVVADAGSFTHAGETLGLSQSAVSRQISALEQELNVPLFHRHARGLILTEQGELLFRTAHDVFMKLETVRTMLADSKEKPSGELRVTTAVGLGSYWLSPRIGEFLDLYPGIRIQLLLSDEELDLSMREADVAIRLWQPVQPDLIQRKLFTVHFHAYATADYLKRHGHPRSPEELDSHRILVVGGSIPHYYERLNWLRDAGRPPNDSRLPALTVNNVIGLKLACEHGVGIATLPDYLVEGSEGLVQLFADSEAPTLEAYFVYPEELRSVARVQVFRDFLVSKAQRWQF
jgi:DNA-binding transcriptional LysR family regulator